MSLNSVLNNVDYGLNRAGEIPIVSTFTGTFRIALGIAETIAAIAMAIFGIIPLLFGNTYLWENCGDHVLNGLMNVLRGSVEVIPLVGNLIMMAVNRSNIFRYGSHVFRDV